jgi:membrane-bound lytic murein transglycosylase MltF
MNILREKYNAGPAIQPAEQVHVAYAAYNAGPAKVQRMRQLAQKMGYDPNVWFGHVEPAALKIVGRETVRYVANIRKCYIAYKLASDKRNLRQQSKPN